MLLSRLVVTMYLLVTASLSGAERDPIEGLWSGKVTAPQGEVVDIAFDFHRTTSGVIGFKLYFPAMFLHGAATGIPVERTGDSDYAITPVFAIQLHLEGDILTGTFSTGRLPLELQRGGAPPAPLSSPQPLVAAPTPLWRYELGSGTWAPPIVDDGIIYVGGGDGRFHAVRANDGTPVWTWPGSVPIDGSAALDSEAVYFLDTRFNLVALDRQQGTLRWRVPLHNEFSAGRSAPDNPTFNHRAATPLVQPGVVYAGSSDGGVYAIESARGGKLWRHEAGAAVFSGIGLRDADTLMFGTMDGSAVLLNHRTRTEVLRVKTGDGVVTTPVIADKLLIVGSRDYQIHAFNLADGSPVWRFSYWFSWIESTPALRDGLLYVGASDYARVTVIDPVTGRARWGTVVGGMDWGTPLVTERFVFTGTVNQNLPGTLINHSAGLVKFDRATGATIWSLELPKAEEGKFAGYAGSLALAGEKVIAAGFDGFLAAYPVE